MTMEGDNERKEIVEIKEKLSKLHEEKEALFAKREQVSNKIRSLISNIKGQKIERNTLTDSVKSVKDERDKLNEEIRTRIAELKKLRASAPKTTPASQSSNPRDRMRDSPGFLRKQIEKLENDIEHEVMSFDKEQKLMKQIKDMKKKLSEMQSGGEVWDKIRKLSKEVDALKKVADEKHKVIQDAAKGSQAKHEGVLGVSKEIDDLKEQEKKLHEEFLAKKEEYTNLNEEYKKLAGIQSDEVHEKRKKRQEEEAQEHAQEMKKLAQRRADVELKLKRGEKLTTEDIIILQSVDD